MARSVLCGALLATLAACGGGSSGGDTLSYEARTEVIPPGQPFAYSSPVIFGAEENYFGHRIGYEAGYDDSGQVTLRAGYQPGDAATALPAAGSADYTGRIDMAVFENFALAADGTVNADYERIYNNTYTLTADFDSQTLTGSANVPTQTDPARSFDIAVNGTYSGNVLNGTMTVGGVTGTPNGEIDSEAIVAAAAGTGTDLSFAGGIILLD